MGKIDALQDSGCAFLQDFRFETLLAPVALRTFLGQHWQKAPLVVHRSTRDYYQDLFSLDDFDRAVANAPSYVKIAEAKAKKVAANEGATSAGLGRTLTDMRAGSTLVLDSLHKRDPKLGLMCRLLTEQLGYDFQTNLYLTPPLGQGFTAHWDNHDVFILQVVGSKHWKIEKQRRKLPWPTESMTEGRELAPDADSFTLEQGDLIYIPRGFVHAAECGAEASLHITLGIHLTTWDDMMGAAVRKLIREDESLRYPLPPGFMTLDTTALVKPLAKALRKISDEQFLAAAVDQYRDELVTRLPLDVSGQISNFFRPQPLSVTDIVGRRRGIVYRMHSNADSVRVNFGANTIRFLPMFREALEFAMRTQVFAVRELPGQLVDDERLALVERLLEEGLLVRK